nr:MAG TPA: hypothetical protein [Caudoviricetes sp.]
MYTLPLQNGVFARAGLCALLPLYCSGAYFHTNPPLCLRLVCN